MTGPLVSTIVVVSREAQYLARTLTSLSVAAAHASSRGVANEIIIAQADPDDFTAAIADGARLHGFAATRRLTFATRSIAQACRAACDVARGAWMHLVDARTMTGETAIVRFLDAAAGTAGRNIYIPGVRCQIGDNPPVRIAARSPHPSSILEGDIYGGQKFLSRELFADIPFPAESSFDPEIAGWAFSAAALAANVRFAPVAGCLSFSRRPPVEGGWMPKTFEVARPDVFPGLFSADTEAAALLESGPFRQKLMALGAGLNAIDPAAIIHPEQLDMQAVAPLQPSAFAEGYARLCRLTGSGTFDEVLILPDTAFRHASLHRPQTQGRVLRVSEGPPGPVDAGSLHKDVTVDLGAVAPTLSRSERVALLAILIGAVAPHAILRLWPGLLAGDILSRRATAFGGNRLILHRPRPDDESHEASAALAFRLLAGNLNAIDEIVADDRETANLDYLRLRVHRAKWRTIPS